MIKLKMTSLKMLDLRWPIRSNHGGLYVIALLILAFRSSSSKVKLRIAFEIDIIKHCLKIYSSIYIFFQFLAFIPTNNLMLYDIYNTSI